MVDTNSLRVKPEGTYLKTCFYREGPYLHAIVTLVKDANCRIFKGSIDLRPIAAAVKRAHAAMHPDSFGAGTGSEVEVGGFFDSITHAVASIGHSKLLAGISKDIKNITGSRSPSSVLLPAVGAPAAAAYALAKTSIDVIDEANAVKSRVAQIANSGSRAARNAAHSKLGEIQTLMSQKDMVQKKLAAMANAARSGNREALAAQRIFAIVLRQHQALKSRVSRPRAARGIPAVMITKTGRVVPGHYLEQRASKRLGQAVLFDGKKILRGKYAAA